MGCPSLPGRDSVAGPTGTLLGAVMGHTCQERVGGWHPLREHRCFLCEQAGLTTVTRVLFQHLRLLRPWPRFGNELTDGFLLSYLENSHFLCAMGPRLK